MILQALYKYYDTLVQRGEVAKPGWSSIKISYGLELNSEGALIGLIPLRIPVQKGKKEVLEGQLMNLPAHVKRSSGVSANYLSDNATYFLGADGKGKSKRSLVCFQTCGELHHALLDGVDHPAARAICAFFDTWEPGKAAEHPLLKDHLEELYDNANLIFCIDGVYAQNIPQLCAAWDAAFQTEGDGVKLRCLVTGERASVALVHPAISKVRGAQSSGAALVSFNAPAYESYGREKEQGLNAPVSKQAAFAYTAALNYLLADSRHVQYFGSTAVVFWAEDGEPAYQDAMGDFLAGGEQDERVAEKDLQDIFSKLAKGHNVAWGGVPLNPSNRFYVLGIAPNAARLSVRFFLQNSFGNFAEKLKAHYDGLEIVRPAFDQQKQLPLWSLLNETVNQNAKDKSPSPQMAGDVLRAMLSGGSYPATLLNQTELRIRAERKVSRGRAAIIKGFLLRNGRMDANYHKYEEVLTVELNEQTTYIPYLLGRMFSVLEEIQAVSYNGGNTGGKGVNATIKDKYFNSACGTPATIFPLLVNLAQKHLRKLEPGLRIHYDRQLMELMGKVREEYPVNMNLHDQGIFQLGYYHQTQKRYTKKEDK